MKYRGYEIETCKVWDDGWWDRCYRDGYACKKLNYKALSENTVKMFIDNYIEEQNRKKLKIKNSKDKEWKEYKRLKKKFKGL